MVQFHYLNIENQYKNAINVSIVSVRWLIFYLYLRKSMSWLSQLRERGQCIFIRFGRVISLKSSILITRWSVDWLPHVRFNHIIGILVCLVLPIWFMFDLIQLWFLLFFLRVFSSTWLCLNVMLIELQLT